jgi:hypothetical protein
VMIYRGRGWLVPVLAILFLVGRGLLESAFHPRLWASLPLSLVVDLGYGAFICWVGVRWNREPLLIEEWRQGEGHVVIKKTAHTFWFIPFEYWGVIIGLLAIWIDHRLRHPSARPFG